MPKYRQKVIRTIGAALFSGAIAALRPRPGGELWEIATGRVVVPRELSPDRSGPLSFELTPYMIGTWSPLWAYIRYQHLDNIWAAQTGKTFMLYLTMWYDIAISTGPGMVVYPDEVTAKRRNEHHIQPFLMANCREFITKADQLEYTTTSGSWFFGWAGSASVLSGVPAKYIKFDEEGKYKQKTAKEADSKRLALRRMVSFGDFGSAMGCTTPSLEHLPGWRDWNGSTQCQHYVPCPECATAREPFTVDGERNRGWQVMYFSREDRQWFVDADEDGKEWNGGIKWDRAEALSREEREESAYYECEDCGAHWTNVQKNAAVSRGTWYARNPKARRYASHLPSWYARWVRLSDVVSHWFDSYKDEEARHDFLNSDCAVPYRPKGNSVDIVALKSHIQAGHHRGTVPPPAAILYLTADVHDDHIRYRVRAWAPDTTSWGVEEGQLPPSLHTLDALLQKTWQTERGSMMIGAGLIDSAWRTDDVYQFCLRHHGMMWPIKGGDQLRELVSYSNQHVIADPEKGLMLGGTITLVHINDPRWKDQLFGRWKVTLHGPGAWYVEEEASDEYWHQLQGEEKREKKDARGRPVFEWVTIHDNHALDCEKYQMVAAEVFQLTSMAAPIEPEHYSPAEIQINPYTGKPIGAA
jgi:phage terminase large subunit GpA-like protein